MGSAAPLHPPPLRSLCFWLPVYGPTALHQPQGLSCSHASHSNSVNKAYPWPVSDTSSLCFSAALSGSVEVCEPPAGDSVDVQSEWEQLSRIFTPKIQVQSMTFCPSSPLPTRESTPWSQICAPVPPFSPLQYPSPPLISFPTSEMSSSSSFTCTSDGRTLCTQY